MRVCVCGVMNEIDRAIATHSSQAPGSPELSPRINFTLWARVLIKNLRLRAHSFGVYKLAFLGCWIAAINYYFQHIYYCVRFSLSISEYCYALEEYNVFSLRSCRLYRVHWRVNMENVTRCPHNEGKTEQLSWNLFDVTITSLVWNWTIYFHHSFKCSSSFVEFWELFSQRINLSIYR